MTFQWFGKCQTGHCIFLFISPDFTTLKNVNIKIHSEKKHISMTFVSESLLKF